MRIPFLLSVVLGSALAGGTALEAQEPPHAGMRLRGGDQIVLQVKNEPALSGRYAISADGAVMLPLVGMILVAGRPFTEIDAMIRTGFARELAQPEVLITPLLRVSALGEVRGPGYHWVEANGTLTDLFVMAGGLLPTASRKKLVLVRGAEHTRIQLDASGAPPRVPLQSGDQLVVGRRNWLSENLAIFIGAAASVAAAAVTSYIVR